MELLGPQASGAYVERIILQDFRCFEEAETKFLYPGGSAANELTYGNVNLVLGTNASGKSALLKAIALSILAPIIPSSGYKPNFLVRRPRKSESRAPQEAVSTTHLLVSTNSKGQIPATSTAKVYAKGDFEFFDSPRKEEDSVWEGLYSNTSPAFFLVAYGATRRVETGEVDLELRDRTRSPRYQRVAGLFEDYVALTPPATWVKHLHVKERLEEACELLSVLLPAEVQPTLAYEEGGPSLLFNAAGTILPFGALADGYRSFIGWVGDLLFHLATVGGPFARLTDIEGIVIVDEIDLHLHPEWQRVVVDRIAKAFPKLQFFLTTHSPLVTGSLQAANIMRCEIDAEGHRSIVPVESSPAGLSADQVLTSDFFGLDSVRSEVAEQGLADIAQRAMEGDADAAAMYLRRLTSGSDVSESL